MEQGNYEAINLTYYNPKTSIFKPNRTDRERYTVYFCCKKDTCDAYKNGQCVMLSGLFGHHCPYGKTQKQEGVTIASRQCGKLIDKVKEQYPDLAYKLKAQTSLCRINDYMYIGLPHLVNLVNSIRERDFFVGNDMVLADKFTAEFVDELMKFQPRALMGGVITDYQTKYIPQFCFRLKRYMPELYEQVRAINSEIDDICNQVSFIGKKANVKTLKSGKVKINIHVVDWDGEHLISDAKELAVCGLKDEKVTIDVTDDTTVVIVDDNTVDSNTVFVD